MYIPRPTPVSRVFVCAWRPAPPRPSVLAHLAARTAKATYLSSFLSRIPPADVCLLASHPIRVWEGSGCWSSFSFLFSDVSMYVFLTPPPPTVLVPILSRRCFLCLLSSVRLLLSLFSEGKAWELASFLSSSKDKVGVVGGATRGDRGETPSAVGAGGVGGLGATPPSAKRARNSLSR